MAEPGLDELNDIQKAVHSLKGKPACLNRNNDIRAGADRINGQEAQRRGAVNNDVIVLVLLLWVAPLLELAHRQR